MIIEGVNNMNDVTLNNDSVVLHWTAELTDTRNGHFNAVDIDSDNNCIVG